MGGKEASLGFDWRMGCAWAEHSTRIGRRVADLFHFLRLTSVDAFEIKPATIWDDEFTSNSNLHSVAGIA
jgi:hypothetical protein